LLSYNSHFGALTDELRDTLRNEFKDAYCSLFSENKKDKENKENSIFDETRKWIWG
jgi:hypothetical protein